MLVDIRQGKEVVVNILNKDIKFKSHYCSINGGVCEKIKVPYINIYIKLDGCNADCAFCEFKNTNVSFNYKKLEENLLSLQKTVRINKISITGGEPTLIVERLYQVLDVIKKASPEAFLVMNTNGYNLKQIDLDGKIKLFDSISISRHHYDDKINESIFKTRIISSKELLSITEKYKETEIFHFSCNLIKEFIDDKIKIYKYLEYCSEMCIFDVGFVGLMEINNFAKENKINLNIKDLESKRFNKIKDMHYYDMCKCNNYLYIPENVDNGIVKVYSRHVLKPADYSNLLVFDGQTMTLDFGGEKLN